MSGLLGTFSRYVARRFLTAILGVYLGCAVLIFLIDFVEMLRRSSAVDNISLGSLMLLSAYRTPSFAEQALPFAVLLGAMVALLSLSRRNELAVARGSGVSAWQFLAPGAATTLLIGIFAVAVYNPLSAHLHTASENMEATLFTDSDSVSVRTGTGRSGVWLQQEGIDGRTVIHAARSRESGTELDEVTVYVYDSSGGFVERIEARTALLRDSYWDLSQAWVISPETEPQHYDNYMVTTYLTRAQIERSVTDPRSISIWALPAFIDLARRAGLATTPYLFQFHLLLARPFALVAMVLIAATVSLRLFRFGNIGRNVIVGIAMGFLFFVATKVLGDFGSGGLMTPAAAAWLPVIVVTLAGLTILLYQEDG